MKFAFALLSVMFVVAALSHADHALGARINVEEMRTRKVLHLDVSLDDKVSAVKQLINKQPGFDHFAPADQVLVYPLPTGYALDDSASLRDSKVTDGATIGLLQKF